MLDRSGNAVERRGEAGTNAKQSWAEVRRKPVVTDQMENNVSKMPTDSFACYIKKDHRSKGFAFYYFSLFLGNDWQGQGDNS